MAVCVPWAVLGVWAVLWVGVEGQGFWWLTTPNTPTTTVTTPVQCECVKYFLCVDGVISTSGVGVLNVRTSLGSAGPVTNVETCPDPIDVCCGLPPPPTTTSLATTTPPPTTTSLATTTPPPTTTQPTTCKCVKFFLCVDGVINTSGEGVIDIRISDGGAPAATNVEVCPDPLDVCCGLPPAPTTSPIPTTTTPQPTLPPDTPCECVPFTSCTGERLVSDGRGNTTLEILGIGFSHSKCTQAFAVCCVPEEPSPTPPTTDQPHSTNLCVCVEPFQCGEDGHIITTGEGIFDIRLLPSPTGRCVNESLVCCRPPREPGTTPRPPSTTTPPPPAPACGTRNTNGLKVSLQNSSLVVMVLLIGQAP